MTISARSSAVTALTGIVDFDSNSVGLAGILFNAHVKAWGGRLTARPIVRTGRGSGGVPKLRLGDLRGGGYGTGEFVPSQWPFPSSIKNATGNIIYQLDKGSGTTHNNSITIPVRITDLQFSHVEKGEGQSTKYQATYKWQLAGQIIVDWNGTQSTIDAPSPNDQETYQGMTKVLDTRGLVTGATQRIDCEGVGDLDSSEAQKLADLIAAAVTPPMANLKVYSASFQKDEDDSTGGQVVITWRLQDSKDNVESPRNTNETDPNNIRDQRTLATVYTTGSPPSTPTPPTGLKIVTYTDQKLNDQLSFRLWMFRRNDSADDILNPQKWVETDPNDLKSQGSDAVIWDPTGSPPADPTPISGQKIRFVKDTTINAVVTDRQYIQAKNDTKDDIELSESSVFTDPTGITSKAIIAKVDGVPTLPDGYVDRGTEDKGLTADGHYVMVGRGGTRSTADDITMPHTSSERSAIGPAVDKIAEIINSVASDQTEADTLWAAVANDDYSLGVQVTSVDVARKLAIYDYVNPGTIVEYVGGGGSRTVYAKIDGDGDVNVYITANYAETSGYRRIRFSPAKLVSRPVRNIIYRRFGKGTSFPDHASQFGTTNNATFDGLAQGTVIYETCSASTRRDVTPRAFFVNLFLREDANGIIDAIPLDLFQGERRIATTWTGTGWTKLSDIANADLTALFPLPTQTDFSFVLATPFV